MDRRVAAGLPWFRTLQLGNAAVARVLTRVEGWGPVCGRPVCSPPHLPLPLSPLTPRLTPRDAGRQRGCPPARRWGAPPPRAYSPRFCVRSCPQAPPPPCGDARLAGRFPRPSPVWLRPRVPDALVLRGSLRVSFSCAPRPPRAPSLVLPPRRPQSVLGPRVQRRFSRPRGGEAAAARGDATFCSS